MRYLILAAIVLGLVVTYWPVAVAVAAGAIGMAVYRQWDRTRRDTALQAAMLVLDPRGAKVDVVGEGNYQGSLEQIAGGRTIDGPVRREHVALLIPEPDNRYDSHAVAVAIDRRIVGYLSAEEAPAYQPPLRRAVAAERAPAAHANLTGGWDRGDGDRGNFGVVLRLGTPESVAAQIDAALAGRA